MILAMFAVFALWALLASLGLLFPDSPSGTQAEGMRVDSSAPPVLRLRRCRRLRAGLPP